MDGHSLPSVEILKCALPKLQKPILFRNMLRNFDGSYEWKLLNWSFSDLVEKFEDKQLPFRVGDYNKCMYTLQHHRRRISPPTKLCKLTLREFFIATGDTTKEGYDKWLYCDYKHMKEFSDKPEIIESFNWLKFGVDKEFGENGLYSTIWIGSKGAHTDCHWDTYGYNLVAQIHGRKLWLLYPPSDSLIPVRLPYEESTVYSKIDIYCLSMEERDLLLKIPDKPKLIILEPGDVLFVPNGWWHYVESLDNITVSVNIWRKLKTDNRARVKEALVKLIVAKMRNYKQFKNKIEYVVTECIKEEEKEKNEKTELPQETPSKKFKPTIWTAEDLAEQYPNYIEVLHDAEEHEFKEFIEERLKRNKEKYSLDEKIASEDDISNPNHYDSCLESVINALCHPDVISKAAQVLLERHY
ncbi:HSPB1-associated protein 1 isoform X1 [Formica exsecta]|uniref:HSPB1-associated protein 1 isoform X1 n=1 Tax=Formica exsecta TaxID=72781 RepID=UPI001142F738|nr:HSPB1-associated protein 1 isoform X1 [Formica exsecta]